MPECDAERIERSTSGQTKSKEFYQLCSYKEDVDLAEKVGRMGNASITSHRRKWRLRQEKNTLRALRERL